MNFCYIFRNFLARVEYKRNSRLKFFSRFLSLSHPVLAKTNAGERFFEFFYYHFRNFLAGVEYERNSGPKFFSLFLGQSHSVLAKNNTGNRIFNFLNFFAIFFGIFLLGSSTNEIQDKNIFLSFSTYLIPFRLKIMLERSFLFFWIFLLFSSEFYCSGRVWTDFETKIFFSLSRPISPRFG